MSNKELEAALAADSKKVQEIHSAVIALISANGWSYRHTFAALASLMVEGALNVQPPMPIEGVVEFITSAYEHIQKHQTKAKNPLIAPGKA